jgi:Na+/proline symporter
MLASVVITVWLIGDALNLSQKSGFVNEIANSGYSKIFYFENWEQGNYFWKHFFGGIFITIGMTGLDQDMMQKNLSCKNLKSAQLNMVSFAGVLVVVNLIFLVLGALLFMYFEKTGFGSEVLKVENPRTDLLFAEIANSGSLGIIVPILFLLGLIAAAYSSADSALTSLTTSFSVDFMNIKSKPIETQNKIRRNSHLLMSFLLIVIILILRNYSNDSAIWMLIKLAGFTYGPLIGLFFFGIITNRELKDKWVPIISIVVPVIVAIVWYFHGQEKIPFLGTYKFGAELIIYNAAMSFLGLLLISKSKS